jgi:hypothetical protein
MSKLMETDFTKAIKDILYREFPDYIPGHIEKVAGEIFTWVGRIDYRLKFVEMCEKDMDRIEKQKTQAKGR